MSKNYTLKKIVGGYKAYYKDKIFIGEFLCGDDGYYNWWPDTRSGYLTSYDLKEIANELDNLNSDWDREVKEALSNIRGVLIMTNLILNTDSYKASQFNQYPPGTEYVFSYGESRGGLYPEITFFGLQMFLKEYLSKPITQADINEAEEFFSAHGEPFNKEGWDYILRKYKGKLPVEIKAVQEGISVPNSNVLFTIQNTDPKCAWLTSYLETALLRAVWYPSTVATNSRSIKKVIYKYLKDTGTPEDISFKLHDFGARGVSSFESAGIGGAAHLINFMGTDTISGALFANKYYNEEMSGFSIPATEHSTMTSWGKENESKAYANMVDKYAKPGSIFAVVSDSYDLYNAVENIWGGELKQKVIDSGATLVIRPDSGNPADVVLKTLWLLESKFGTTKNSKGFKVLNYVRVIQGDGINESTIREILNTAVGAGFSADNIAFGMGGALLQQVNRDTNKFAMKASAAKINGKWVDVYKDPVTDSGKRSKRGRLMLVKDDFGNLRTVTKNAVGDQVEMLTTVFLNGEIVKEYSLAEVRENAKVT